MGVLGFLSSYYVLVSRYSPRRGTVGNMTVVVRFIRGVVDEYWVGEGMVGMDGSH